MYRMEYGYEKFNSSNVSLSKSRAVIQLIHYIRLIDMTCIMYCIYIRYSGRTLVCHQKHSIENNATGAKTMLALFTTPCE